jgi:Arc/MetJ-type ribon-helix-helix transcriptional regulator
LSPAAGIRVEQIGSVAPIFEATTNRGRSSGRSMFCATLGRVSRSLHVRLDDSSVAALSVIRNDGLSDSEAVRTALRETAARRRARSAIAAEVRRLAGDANDQAEMRAIREQMAELAPEPTD